MGGLSDRTAIAGAAPCRRRCAARAFAATDLDVRERVVPSAEVGDALISLAQDTDAAVLVLGRDADGHVTRSLVPRSPCPVAVAPLSVPLPQPPGFGRLGVAYDGSAFASWALVVARELTLATGAQLVVYAAGPTSERASTCLHRARLLLGRTVGFQARALVDDPAGGLTQASAELDLLVCGSRGRGRPLAAILGSVSAHLVAHAQCPVLVVPPGVWRSETSPLAICSAAALL